MLITMLFQFIKRLKIALIQPLPLPSTPHPAWYGLPRESIIFYKNPFRNGLEDQMFEAL